MMTSLHPPSMILKQLLISNNVGVDVDANCDLALNEEAKDWLIYISHKPDADNVPDNIIVIYDTEGTKDGRLMAGTSILHPGCQIVIRSDTYTGGWAKIREVLNLFETVLRTPVTVDTTTYELQNISITSPILPLGIAEGDTKRRDLFSLNTLLTINENE